MKTNKVKLSMLFMLTLMVGLLSTNFAFAQVDESKAEKKEDKIITKIISKEEPKEEIEVRLPNKLTPKEPPKNTEGGENEEKGNTNKGVATPPSKARASLIESVDNKNAEYEIYRGLEEDKEPNKYAADARQFITFKTKNGKTFHLVINHDEASENVMLLTEVSEDDLLNFVEPKEKKEEPIKEVLPKEEPIKEDKKPDEKEKSDFGTYLIIFVIGLAVLGAGYYFKVIKRKEEEELKDFENEESDEEYYSEYEGNHEEQKDVKGMDKSQNRAETTDEVEYEDIDEEDLL